MEPFKIPALYGEKISLLKLKQEAIRENKVKQEQLTQKIAEASEDSRPSLQSDLDYLKQVYTLISNQITQLLNY